MAGLLPATAQAPAAAGAAPAAAAPATPAPAFAGGGEQTCLKCHSTDAKVVPILQTPHAVKGDPHAPFGQDGCESCHGPSAAHVATRANEPAIVFKGPAISSVDAMNKACLSCHDNGLRMNWPGSQHQTSDTACVSCHTIHVKKDPVLKKETQPEKCFTCHSQQRAESFELSHHPIREGKVVCSDCHNPHGSPGPKLLKEFTVNDTCYTCHADKRGPFLWEHEPVRDDCTICHSPHGSTQTRLLKERAPFLCTNCHNEGGHQAALFSGSVTPGIGAQTLNVRMMGRGCVNCHSQIHGSNSQGGSFFNR